jgi:hypothetical protein
MAKQNLVSPIGTFVHPKISQPDTQGEFADNKYKTYLALDAQDMASFKSQLDAIAKAETFKVKQPKMPFKTLTDGREVIRATSAFKPLAFDARKQPIREDAVIGGGSTGRISVEVYNYDKGLSLRLKKVQVIDLKSWGGADEFDEVDDGFGTSDEDDAGSNNELDI